MKRFTCLLAMSITLLCQLAAKPVPRLPERKDEELLQGEWMMVSFEMNGSKAEKPATALTLTIKGNKWIGSTASDNTPPTFKIDQSTNPKRIDLIHKNGGVIPGIYKLEGDVFTMCRPIGIGKRPTEFKGDDVVVMSWKRTNKTK